MYIYVYMYILSSQEFSDTHVCAPVQHPVTRNLTSDTLPEIRGLKPERPHQKRTQCPCSAPKRPNGN